MAPAKISKAPKFPERNVSMPVTRRGFARRMMSNIADQNVNVDGVQTRGKRKAEHSPVKNEKIKRSAFGNLTNNGKLTTSILTQLPDENAKEQKTKREQGIKQAQVFKDLECVNAKSQQVTRQPHKPVTRSSTKNTVNSKLAEIAILSDGAPPARTIKVQPMRRISNEFEKTEESLYMSALEDVSSCESTRLSGAFEAAKRRSELLLKKAKTETVVQNAAEETDVLDQLKTNVPNNVEDFDKANWDDPFQVSHYAIDIFNYLRMREAEFLIDNYMERQTHLSKAMRSLLVDWMVEVQETFELNHETLYLAVKIVDLYLCRIVINKDKLQLLGAAALFIACKYDERTPPLIEDFLYICDGAYSHDELVKMEMKALQTINFDLGIPLSYRFLRRYARCAKVQMPALTLARYILELSLMDYETIRFSDSKLASACLFMALRLHGNKKPWSPTLEYYSSYKLIDFANIVPVLNAGMHRKPKGPIKTIRCKYSHKIFYEVAKVPLMTTEQIFEDNLPTGRGDDSIKETELSI